MSEIKLNKWYTLAFFAGIIILVVAELIGVASKGEGDTLTEHYRWAKNKMNDAGAVGKIGAFVLTLGTIGFFGWWLLHWVLPAGTI